VTQPTTGIWGVRNGLNLDNLETTTDDEIDEFLADARKGRGPLDPGPLYNMTSNSLWLYTRPDFAKLHGRMSVGLGMHGLERVITAMSFTNLHAYINQAWEIGIENCTRGLQQQGVTRAQLMETIMHAQLSAGIRGLECCYRALGIILRDYAERPEPAVFPAGWAPDMPAFYCGLDPTTRELTPDDQRAIESWYERTIGEVPRWVRVLARVDPLSLKAHRARWEGCFRGALPKQMMPYLSIHQHTIVGNREGLREAVLLGKAWGINNACIVHTIVTAAYYFTGLERMDMLDEDIVAALA
jgi:hypothetical protein